MDVPSELPHALCSYSAAESEMTSGCVSGSCTSSGSLRQYPEQYSIWGDTPGESNHGGSGDDSVVMERGAFVFEATITGACTMSCSLASSAGVIS